MWQGVVRGVLEFQHVKIWRCQLPRVSGGINESLTALPADERLDVLAGDRCHVHGHGLRCGQPVGVVITGGKVADIVDVAEHVGHGAESGQAATRGACWDWV